MNTRSRFRRWAPQGRATTESVRGLSCRRSYATHPRDGGRGCRCPARSVQRESLVSPVFFRREPTQGGPRGSRTADSRPQHRGHATPVSRDGTTLVTCENCSTRCSEQSRRKVVAQSYGATATEERSPRLPGRQRHQHRRHGAMSGGPFSWPFEKTDPAPRDHRTQLRSQASPRPDTNAARMSP
jgi:hypothetical protein